MQKCQPSPFAVTLDGHIVAKKESPAVSMELLAEILDWKLEGATDKDVLCRLRHRTVPAGYSYHSWCTGIMHSQIALDVNVSVEL